MDSGCLVCSNSTLCTIYASQSSTTVTVSNWAYVAIAGAGLLALILLIMLACCLYRNFCKSEEDNRESVVGVTEREMVISSRPGEKDFEIQHDGLCKLCGENKLEVMNIELLCFKCEAEGSEQRTDYTRPIRKEIVISSSNPDERETD